MRVEIEAEVPEGYTAVAYRAPVLGDWYLSGNTVYLCEESHWSGPSMLILVPETPSA